MAKQVSPIVKLKGTIDGINFYNADGEFMARAKGGVSAERILNDPKFKLTRLNGQEFGIGGKAGKLFRAALKEEIAKAADKRLTSRLTKSMVAVLQTDPTSDYGYRKVENGNLLLLAGFEFNANVSFSSVLELEPSLNLNRSTGQAIITIPALTPQTKIVAPDGTSHYSVFAAVAPINFAAETNSTSRQSSGYKPYDNNTAAATTLTIPFTAGSPHPVFVLLGIEFVKMVNGKVYEQSTGQNALKIMAIDIPVIDL